RVTSGGGRRRACRVGQDPGGARGGGWRELPADEVVRKSGAAGARGRESGPTRRTPAEVGDYFAGLARDWEMLYYAAEEFIAEGDRVVMVGRGKWRFRRTGKEVESPIINVWRFRDGKAIEFFEFYDTAKAFAATQPGCAARLDLAAGGQGATVVGPVAHAATEPGSPPDMQVGTSNGVRSSLSMRRHTAWGVRAPEIKSGALAPCPPDPLGSLPVRTLTTKISPDPLCSAPWEIPSMSTPYSVTRLLGLGLTPGKLRGLQRISNPTGTLTMVATDQNSSMISMKKKATG